MNNLEFTDRFIERHNGPDDGTVSDMLKVVGYSSIDELINDTIPAGIRMKSELDLSESLTEYEFINHLKDISFKNKIYKSFIGMGYYPSFTPPVIQRNILENPGWYTQYTPYQAEISQGRLEALLNFQTMVCDLTGMPIANASLLDEGTAAAEAMLMMHSLRKGEKKNCNKFFISDEVFPQTIDVVISRANALGIEVLSGDWSDLGNRDEIFGVLVQYPAMSGDIYDYKQFFEKNSEEGIFNAVAADLMSLALLNPPGEFGADVVVGTTQRFGIPMSFGGPHAAYFAVKEEYKRQIPGRIIGMSVDKNDNPALRMALQTREQHIKRDKATSNICTAQVLLAIMASMYAVYHGPAGIKKIANRINDLTIYLAAGLKKLKYHINNDTFFDTLSINAGKNTDNIKKLAEEKQINFYYKDEEVLISLSEITSLPEVNEILSIFAQVRFAEFNPEGDKEYAPSIPVNLQRTSGYLQHPVFNSFHSETEMMRYIKRLEKKDLSLTKSMIPLGSCTMKLNAVSEMLGVTWPEFSNIHPFAPAEQTEGYKILITELERELAAITGFSAVSMQTNSGAQGEYAGLMVINAYHKSRGEENRNIILIPSSAHGTNPASAVMAGGRVVVIACDEKGNIDVDDLKLKAEENKNDLSALMVTYPSTHGVFEEDIIEICEIIHNNGGQVYMDGANMNAQVGLTSPAIIGADVCHLNLHKTFTIPHGGGGPGVGPIAAAEHLAPFLPGHSIVKTGGNKAIKALSSAPWGSAGILMISYAYIKMTGKYGIVKATQAAILNANYIRARLKNEFSILYVGRKGNVGHEMIVDMRGFKQTANVEVEDIAKRLMDYGFHAPTVSFPVPGTLMIEPTESESKAELDRFCEALLSIKNEIVEIEKGISDKEDNVLKNAPHTLLEVTRSEWLHSYSREKAAFPLEWIKDDKFWPSAARINNAFGDRNLVCTCPPIEEYSQ